MFYGRCIIVFLIGWLRTFDSASAQELYDLGSLGGGGTMPTAINSSGDVVGYSYTSNNYVNAFIYSGGVISDLGTLPNETQSYAQAINDSGAVVGYAIDSLGDSNAVSFSNGTANELLSSSIVSSNARGINNSGEIVGYASQFPQGGAFSESGGTMTSLGGGSGSAANAVNASGQIVVYNASQGKTFLYSNGSLTNIPTLGSYVDGAAINSLGQVVGTSGTAHGPAAFLYSGGATTNLGTLGGLEAFANGINDSGEIVGTSTTSNAVGTAFLYTGGMLKNLNTLYSGLLVPGGNTSPNGFNYLESATAINDDGEIVGTGEYYDNGSYSTQAFLLVPAPEPSSWAMLLGSVGLLILRASVCLRKQV